MLMGFTRGLGNNSPSVFYSRQIIAYWTDPPAWGSRQTSLSGADTLRLETPGARNAQKSIPSPFHPGPSDANCLAIAERRQPILLYCGSGLTRPQDWGGPVVKGSVKSRFACNDSW